MKITNKLISLFIAIVLIITSVPFGSLSVLASENDNAIVTVNSVSGKPGDTVDVTVNIKNNPGIIGAIVTLKYDDELTLESVSSGEAFESLSFSKSKNLTSPCKFSWDASDLMPEDIKDGKILKLSFKIADNATPGEKAVNISYEDGDVIDYDLNLIELEIINNSVNVMSYMPGDVNDDGKVNATDVVLIRRHITGGYGVNINTDAADVNADGRINTTDLVLIRRFIVGGYGVELKPSPDPPNHTIENEERKEPTCTEDGNIAYWHCTTCDKYFSDSKCVKTIQCEDTVIKATGHTVVTDPAVAPSYTETGLTEGSHCSVCNTVIKAQEVIPKLQRTEYSITYHISNGDEYLAKQDIENTNPDTYTSEEGISRLANPSVPGYQFLGWYDLPSGDAAENIKSIPVGTTGNIDLYAKWEKLSYKVNFSSDLIPVASETYTVDEEHVLPSPKLDGYIFAGWSDDEGTVIKNIPSGTVGAKTYTANWISERNQAWTYNNVGTPLMYEDNESNTILFVYNIGEIRNVPLSVVHDFGKINSNGVTRTHTETFKKSVSQECMDKYTNTVQKATTDSYSWTLAKEWSNSTTVNETWAKENSVTEEQVNSYYKDQSNNWYVSSGRSGSNSITSTDSSSDSTMLSSTRNKKTDDKHSASVEKNVSANLDVKNTLTVGAEIPIKFVDVSAENKTEIGCGVSGSVNTKESASNRVQTDNTDSAQYNKSNYSSTTANSTASWNTESGYGGSSAVGESHTASKAISEKISEQYNIGKSYISTDSESSTQGTQTSQSNSDEYSSAVTYSTIEGQEVTETYTTQNTMSGYHRWIMAGTAHVFGVVGYDIASKSYFTTTYSVMDDKMYEYEDYSYQTASYDDNESSLVKFEVPMDITTYVGNRICESEGLEVSRSGIITNYNGNDKYVVIPEYKVIDNQDGTSSVIQVTGISPTAFAGKDITGIELSDFITEIPDNAFKNCTSLESINAAGITKIGNNAFEGCTSLEELVIGNNITKVGTNIVSNETVLTVSATSKSVVEAAVQSGAKEIYIRITNKCTDLSNTTLNVPNTTETFILNGFGKTYNNVRIVSDAKKTIINRANFKCTGQTPLVISSSNVELHEVNVTSPGICLALTADNTNLALRGESTLNSSSENSMLCKTISINQIDAALTTSLTVNGNLLIYTSEDSILSGDSLLHVTGQIIGITLEEFNNYLKGVFTIAFNANGGTVSETNRKVVYGSKLGTLPTPTRDYNKFVGWFTKADGGEQITDETVFTSSEDVTYYAHWKDGDIIGWVLASSVPSGALIKDQKWTYDLTTTKTSSNKSESGYTLYNTTWAWGSYGSWSGWSDTKYTASDSRQIETRKVETSRTTWYHYYRYAQTRTGGYGSYEKSSNYPNYYTYDFTSPLTEYESGKFKYWYSSSNWNTLYKCSPYTTTDIKYKTQYRYRDRSKVYTYYHKKVEQKESKTEVTASSTISNVKKYVKYIAK